MSKRWMMGVLLLASCSDDDAADARLGAVQCAQLSVDECGQQSSCQVLSESDGGLRCGEERVGVRGCSVMSVDECKRDARCQTIDGRPFDEDRECRGESEPLGCQERGVSCPPAVLYAQREQKSYEFVHGCVPPSFERFSPAKPPQQAWLDCKVRAGGCEAHKPAECASDKRCMTIEGRPFVGPGFGDLTPLACTESRICSEALVIACSPQGQRWSFNNGCLPPGYEAESGDGSSKCTALPKTCEQLSDVECAARKECRRIDAVGYDAARMCSYGRKFVGCSSAQGCSELMTFGRDRAGGTWVFWDGCQPVGFEMFMPDIQPRSTWPSCN